ncbi:MAG: MBL fold metallo-hydrolase, partial [Steroidobacterales bacterium]
MIAALLSALLLEVSAFAVPPPMRVTLLGTGTPTPESDRAGASVLVQANGVSLVFDAGRSIVVRLHAAGLRLDGIDAVFLTHLHFDHVTGLPDLLLTSRMPADYGQRTKPLPLFGPRGTSALARGIEAAFGGDIDLRHRTQSLSPEVARFLASEFNADGIVFERAGVT